MEAEGPRILLVDDEQSMRDFLSHNLHPAGYRIHSAATGEEALQEFHVARPDLILLDLSLPDLDGKEVIRRLREWAPTPIVVMSARHEESERIQALDEGADDFVTKPLDTGELLARLRAVLRRALDASHGDIFTAGDLQIDFGRRVVTVDREQVKLTATEYDLLKIFARHVGLVRTHRQLIHELWGGTHYQDAVHLLRVTVSNLRRKLGRGTSGTPLIMTEAGIGYRLLTDAEFVRGAENMEADV